MIKNFILAKTEILDTGKYSTNLPHAGANHANITNLLQIVFGVLGALSVLMIVIGGLRFVTAQGNPQDTAKARNTIIYSVVGLVIAIVAEALVSFVLRTI